MVRRSRGIGAEGTSSAIFYVMQKGKSTRTSNEVRKRLGMLPGAPEEMAEAPRGVTGASYEKALSPPMSATCPRTAS